MKAMLSFSLIAFFASYDLAIHFGLKEPFWFQTPKASALTEALGFPARLEERTGSAST